MASGGKIRISLKKTNVEESQPLPVKPTIKKAATTTLKPQRKPTKRTTKSRPALSDSLYKFYSSLLQQNPRSKMAKKWLLDHDCFEEKEAKIVALELSLEEMHI